MVKNTIGGKKGKSIAKKNVMVSNDNIRLSQDENEIYVVCTKLYGNGIFCVVDNLGIEYQAVLRGKMKGFNKRHNLVSLFSILLVGKRIDLSDKSVVDILFVFDHSHIPVLSLIPTIKLNHILNIHYNGVSNTGGGMSSGKSSEDITFSNDDMLNFNIPKICTDLRTDSDTELDTDFDICDI